MIPNYEFAIRKTQLKSGETIFTPLCREKSKLGRILSSKWIRIVKIYDKYILMELEWEPKNLTFEDCQEHIEKYKEHLQIQRSNEIFKTEVLNQTT